MAPAPGGGGAAARPSAQRLPLRRFLPSALLAAGLVAPFPAHAGASIQQLEATLDALIAHQLPSHGWTFGTHAGERPEPATYVMGLAERVAAPVGLAQWDLVVLRSPGTPAAALVLLGGYRLTGRPEYLAAARAAGDLLVEIQLSTGGWFSEMPVEDGAVPGWFPRLVRRTTLDDDVTSGGARLLLALWEATGEIVYRRAAERALDLLRDAQLPSGAWPLVVRGTWVQRLWPTFENLPSLNDAATAGPIEVLLLGGRLLDRPELTAAARRGGDWLTRVRAAVPQAGWAQQYDLPGHPAPARRFEPAALAAWESRHALDALLALAAATRESRWCEPVADAVAWLARSAIRPGCWARFYEIGSNEPVYLSSRGVRVTSPDAARIHYDWTGDFGIPGLFTRLGLDADGQPIGGDRAAAAERLPGDSGPCGLPNRRIYPESVTDPRALIADAGHLLAALAPGPAAPCHLGGPRTASAR